MRKRATNNILFTHTRFNSVNNFVFGITYF